jgi:hypothetical protein
MEIVSYPGLAPSIRVCSGKVKDGKKINKVPMANMKISSMCAMTAVRFQNIL